ncbi:MAG TPA: glycogen debranching protein GlgX, partial [Thermoanaerobaculia bacterium]|nr:glycogen debranching protein GlgX [Thermoanaerobaculia bacterium]
MSFEIQPGQPFPLGATPDADGVNFAVWSSVAESVELSFFDWDGREVRRPLPGRTDGVDGGTVHHGRVPGASVGWHYGFRVHGPFQPEEGHLCNPAKLLLDPYARAVAGGVTWHDAVLPYVPGKEATASRLDSAPYVPRSVVVDPRGGVPDGDWRGDERPGTPLGDTVIYETHVKGFTARHPDLPPELRGTYRGLAHPAAVEHLRSLGVTAVELLPVHHFLSRRFLVQRGLTNYWGYDPVVFAAPHAGYAVADPGGGPGRDPVGDFRAMVHGLHAAGLEVYLDVVFNHTCEGGPLGPSLSLRGFDNAAYYRASVDYTGTGASVDGRHPAVVRLIVESLARWVEELHVDGFRFDLATTLVRGDAGYRRDHPLFAAIAAEPALAEVKLIAEPWDAAPGGYQVGAFPPPWLEWNGRYRDTVRDFWNGRAGTLPDLASRLTGSAGLYAERGPRASVGFVTCHDGFPLADLVSYDAKHNEANGEGNRDGTNDNRSWNHGHEGPTDDPRIQALRRRTRRNLVTTLLLSQGTPMLLGGDEIGRSQGGNNNAYCQDNEISWYDWESVDEPFLAFTRRLVALRRDHPVFRLGSHQAIAEAIHWFTPGGEEKTADDWNQGWARSVAMLLDGRRVGDGVFLLLVNAHHEALEFRLPAVEGVGVDQQQEDAVAHPPAV